MKTNLPDFCPQCGRNEDKCDCGMPPEPKATGMTLEEAKQHLKDRQTQGAFGLTWDEIERKQGGKLRR